MFGPTPLGVVVYELRHGELTVRGAAGTGGPPSEAAQAAGSVFARLVIEQNRAACLNDASLRADLLPEPAGADRATGAALAAPLRVEGQAFGAVVILGRSPQEWTAEQFRVAGWLARQASDILRTLRLQEQLRRQAALLDLSPDAIIVRRLDGTITMWGRGAEQLYGWTKDDVLGRQTHSLLCTRFPLPLEEVNDCLTKTGRWSGELVHRAKSGGEVIVDSRWLAERDARGEVSEVLESNVDITERKRAEAVLQEEDRRKNEFLATLSHELRNPLAPIRYALDLLNQPDGGDGPAQAKRVIERQVEHLVRLVDDLLDITRIASNKVRLRTERVRLADVLEHVVDAVTSEVQAAQHSLAVSLPQEVLWLDADAVRLSQVFTNLLVNAVRYTPAGGSITVTATANETEVIVTVADTGVGLKPDDLRRVFEMFAQVGEAKHGGLGIGLALVKGLVELHGGSVEARSNGAGHGAEFAVRLPRAKAPGPIQDVAGQQEASDEVRRRVLVVDDNVDSADMMQMFLELEGHDVQVAYDGTSALEKAASLRPDVGLFDIGLPDMDGYELAERLRADPANRAIYLVAVTGWGQDSDRERARQSGFDAHLTKPPSPDAIRSVVAAARGVAARSVG